jgi:hypothetical protein
MVLATRNDYNVVTTISQRMCQPGQLYVLQGSRLAAAMMGEMIVRNSDAHGHNVKRAGEFLSKNLTFACWLALPISEATWKQSFFSIT